MASLLPHQLKGLSSFVVEKVISDGAEGGALNGRLHPASLTPAASTD